MKARNVRATLLGRVIPAVVLLASVGIGLALAGMATMFGAFAGR